MAFPVQASVSGQRSRFLRRAARVSLRTASGKQNNDSAEQLSKALGISLIAAKILVGRGITAVEEARRFLSPTLRTDIPDPFSMINIAQAADMLLETVRSGEQITVYSDFDVDGLSSAAQLVQFLHELKAAVNNYTPNRFTEGYGLSRAAVEALARAGTKLLVTVDCGISNHEEIALARRLGMRTIIIDHHLPHDLPPADLIVDPLQEGCPFAEHQLAAAGLVWVLLIVLRAKLRAGMTDNEQGGSDEMPDPKDFLDLAALGTICDMVPLVGLNRLIAHRGMEALRQTTRPGIVALKDLLGVSGGKRITAGHVGFGFGPRINAAGRLGDAGDVFKLLTTNSSKRAKELAEAIERANTRRRTIEEQVLVQCLSLLGKGDSLEEQPAFALFGQDFHIGVIGIVAQRLVEEFHRPAALMAPGEMKVGGETRQIVRGSVRGIRGFHVAEALKRSGSFLINYGGHEGAGGFSIAYENVEGFSLAFIEDARKVITAEMLERERFADVEVCLSEIDYDVVDGISKLAPFGVGNPSPLLLVSGVTVETVSSFGKDHLRVRFSDGSHYVNGVCWGFQGHPLLRKGECVNIAFYPEINTYKGISAVQLNVQEVWK